MSDFATYILQVENVLIMLASSAVIFTARQALPSLRHNAAWARLLPVLPVALCSLAVWMPGLVGGRASQKLLLGIVLGALSGHAYKLVTQTVFGNDRSIRGHRSRL